jgi:hypothetical protein
MSIAGMLFADKEVPLQLRVRDELRYRKVPDEPMEPGHWDMWNKCFSNIPPSLPRYHYMFFFGEYGQGEDGSKTERFRENTEGNRLFVVRLIRDYGVEPLYINLYAEHVLTEEDVRNATEVNPAKVSFVGGDAPKTLKFETDRFYRFTYRRASEIRTYCCPSSAPAHAMDY